MKTIEQYLTRDAWKEDWQETKSHARVGLEAVVKVARAPYDLYRNNTLVNMNANVLAAAYPSIEAAAQTSRIMQEEGYSEAAVSGGAAAADWLAYIPIHLALHYFSNKKKFTKENGKLDKGSFLKDVGKVYLTQLPSIALFYAMASPLQYGLMKSGLDGGNANRVSFWGTLAATRALHTFNYWNIGRKEAKKKAEAKEILKELEEIEIFPKT